MKGTITVIQSAATGQYRGAQQVDRDRIWRIFRRYTLSGADLGSLSIAGYNVTYPGAQE